MTVVVKTKYAVLLQEFVQLPFCLPC